MWVLTDTDDALGGLLCKYEHCFWRNSTDLGHVTVERFRIILKNDERPFKATTVQAPSRFGIQGRGKD